jgi:cell division protein FtsI/penicillin-binding protein 2
MTWRYRVLLLCFVLLFSVVLARLFYWQVVRAEELTALGESQYGRRIKTTPLRGEIKTTDGYAIAANKVAYLVYANPKQVRDDTLVSNVLSPILDVDAATISSNLALDRYWVALKSHIDSVKKTEIEKLNLPGVGFEEHALRFYPEASLAAKILGFVGRDENGDPKGYFGLEGYYDLQLRGKEGTAVQIHDALGRPILARMKEEHGGTDGRNLVLNIDRVVQLLAEQELKAGIERYGAEGGMVAVMEPKTGNVVAMASFPTFDPRAYQEYGDDLYKNPFISDTYEPGSTFKPLVMAAAIDSGLVQPNTPCSICGSPVEIGGYEIRTWNNKYQEGITMTDTIIRSDNTGMVFVAQKMGLERMVSYFKKFGIGDLTGIDLQGEVAPGLRPEDQWYPIDVATASFGQGISITPIELLSGFSAIANGGVRMEPHVVSAIETPDGQVLPITPKELSRPISPKTARIMTEILVNAVDKGESKWVKPKGYRVAGKTGTAQIPIAGHYDPNKTIASFIGFAPADDPKFVMLVVVNKPTTSIYGSETAAPIFMAVARTLLAYYGIPPTEATD